VFHSIQDELSPGSLRTGAGMIPENIIMNRIIHIQEGTGQPLSYSERVDPKTSSALFVFVF